MNHRSWNSYRIEFDKLIKYAINEDESDRPDAEAIFFKLRAEMAYHVRLNQPKIRELLKSIPAGCNRDSISQLHAFFENIPYFDDGFKWDGKTRTYINMWVHGLGSAEDSSLEFETGYYQLRSILSLYFPDDEKYEWAKNLIDEVPWLKSPESTRQLKAYMNVILPRISDIFNYDDDQ